MSQATTWGCPRQSDGVTPPGTMATRIDESLDALLSSHRGSARPSYAVAGTIWNDSDTDDVFFYDGANDFRIAVNVGAPSGSGDAGVLGQVAWDTAYFYVCTATDTWARVALDPSW